MRNNSNPEITRNMAEEKGMQKYFAPALTSVETYQSLSIQNV